MILFSILYSLFIFAIIYSVYHQSLNKIEQDIPLQKFSVIIAFRNEAENLECLLTHLYQLDYPLDAFEVILINDVSTDDYKSILKPWLAIYTNLTVINSQRQSISPKKDAIAIGIQKAKYDWIVTTDADCFMHQNWLHYFNSTIYKKQALLVCGGVQYTSPNTWLSQYQYLESISLLGITWGSFALDQPVMCNAANMAYHKDSFTAIQNHQSIKAVSGDDIFTLESFKKYYPNQIAFNFHPEALVTTVPENTWKKILQQRIRWAAKSVYYKSVVTKTIGLLVLLIQLILVFGWLIYPNMTLITWVLKLIIDSVLIWVTAHKTNQQFSWKYYLPIAFIYPFINTYIGIRALAGNYSWKERKFNR